MCNTIFQSPLLVSCISLLIGVVSVLFKIKSLLLRHFLYKISKDYGGAICTITIETLRRFIAKQVVFFLYVCYNIGIKKKSHQRVQGVRLISELYKVKCA